MRQQGFTLLEVLVALTIFAVMAGGFLTASSQSLRQMQHMEAKTFAEWVAENKLAEIRSMRAWLPVGESSDHAALGGRDWEVRVRVAATAEVNMRQVDVDVTEAGHEGSLVTLTGFVGKY